MTPEILTREQAISEFAHAAWSSGSSFAEMCDRMMFAGWNKDEQQRAQELWIQCERDLQMSPKVQGWGTVCDHSAADLVRRRAP